MLQCVAELQCVAVCCNVLQLESELADTQHHLEEVCCNVLQCIVVCGSVL